MPAGDSRQMCEMNCRQYADVDFRIAECRALAGENDIAGNCQRHAAAARGAADRRDRRFAEVVLTIVQFDVKFLQQFTDLFAGFAEQQSEIETGAEALRNCAGEHDRPRMVVGRRASQCGDDGANYLQAQSIDRRSVKRDARYAIGDRIADAGIGHARLFAWPFFRDEQRGARA